MDAIDRRFTGQVPDPRSDHTDLMAKRGQAFGDRGGNASAPTTDRRVFVTEDEDFHGRNLS
jgi:hypothetical protein